MRTLFTLCLLSFSLIQYAQETENVKQSRIAIGASFSPDYSYRTLRSDANLDFLVRFRDSLETPRLGFTMGLFSLINMNKRITIETGIKYSDKGEQIKNIVLTYAVPDPSAPEKITLKYKYEYFDIPLKINYYLLTGKFKAFISAGASFNLFVRSRTVAIAEYGNGEQIKTSQTDIVLKRFNFAAIAGFGIDYALSPMVNIRIEPEFRYFLTSISPGSIAQYPYSAGVNVGLILNL